MMLTVIKNESGEIQACCEWRIVDRWGRPNPEGKFIWIADLEVSPNHQDSFVIKKVIEAIAAKSEGTEWVYFRRNKYNLRIRIYPREKFINFAKERKCSLSF